LVSLRETTAGKIATAVVSDGCHTQLLFREQSK